MSSAFLRIVAVVSFALAARSERDVPEALVPGGDPPRVVSMEPESLAEDLESKDPIPERALDLMRQKIKN